MALTWRHFCGRRSRAPLASGATRKRRHSMGIIRHFGVARAARRPAGYSIGRAAAREIARLKCGNLMNLPAAAAAARKRR